MLRRCDHHRHDHDEYGSLRLENTLFSFFPRRYSLLLVIHRSIRNRGNGRRFLQETMLCFFQFFSLLSSSHITTTAASTFQAFRDILYRTCGRLLPQHTNVLVLIRLFRVVKWSNLFCQKEKETFFFILRPLRHTIQTSKLLYLLPIFLVWEYSEAVTMNTAKKKKGWREREREK